MSTATSIAAISSTARNALHRAVEYGDLFGDCAIPWATSIRERGISELIEKGFFRRKPHGYVEITEAGRAAYAQLERRGN
jgi:hypothetical protein